MSEPIQTGPEWGVEPEGGGNDPVAHLLRLAQDPLGAARRRWPWMVAACIAGLVATAVFVTSIEPTYQARATVLISGQQIPEDFVRSTVREGSLANLNAMVAQVLSQNNLSELIEKHHLYPKLQGKAPLIEVINTMRGAIEIAQDRKIASNDSDRSQIFAISYVSKDQDLAATVANELASDFVDAGIERRAQQARQTTEFLRRELTRAERELRDINAKIGQFQRDHRGELPGDLETTLRKLERLEQQRESLTRQISAQEDRILVVSGRKGDATAAEQTLADLRAQLARELSVNTEEHPNVIALKRRIELVEKQLGNGGTPLPVPANSDRALRLESERRDLEQLRKQLAAASAEIAELDKRVDRIPVVGEDLSALEEKAVVLRENYLDFLRKVQDAELAQTLESAQQGPRVTVLDQAQRPAGPTQPPWLIAVVGVVASLLLGLVVAVALEVLDPYVLASEQLEPLAAAPAIGSFPRT